MTTIIIDQSPSKQRYLRAIESVCDEFLALGGGDNQLLINDVISVLAIKRAKQRKPIWNTKKSLSRSTLTTIR
ncbi:MAG: hypothetical protein IJ602_02655 [Paludibacteraceae bacterium]|nr:hypothetical protein [Paludibacteraceae bacterium]